MGNTAFQMTLIREPFTADVIILGCVATKHPGPAKAKDLYASPMFAKRRRYAEMSGKPWVIFSAQHGILDPDDVIDWYDVDMTKLSVTARRAKGAQAAAQLEQVASAQFTLYDLY